MSRESLAPELERGEEYNVEEALREAGLSGVEAPRSGTPAYERLTRAAENYITEVVKGETRSPMRPMTSDAENYFAKPRVKFSSSDTIRREYHNELSMMLFGSTRKELSKEDADRVSNFAAYVTGHEEYVDTW
jgi:hypothetical protein